MKFQTIVAAACLTGAGLVGATPVAAQTASLRATTSLTLSEGFEPDPQTVEIDLPPGTVRPRVVGTCAGLIHEAPQLRLQYTAGDFSLTIKATALEDIAILIQRPDGLYNCDDDTNGTNPSLTYDEPDSGVYYVWIASLKSTTSRVRISVTELTEDEDWY